MFSSSYGGLAWGDFGRGIAASEVRRQRCTSDRAIGGLTCAPKIPNGSASDENVLKSSPHIFHQARTRSMLSQALRLPESLEFLCLNWVSSVGPACQILRPTRRLWVGSARGGPGWPSICRQPLIAVLLARRSFAYCPSHWFHPPTSCPFLDDLLAIARVRIFHQ